jgi:hypothetical protein
MSENPDNVQEMERKAAALGLTLQEYDDLQVWLRHGRIGIGRTYQQEVERARKIEGLA